ncbi:response regulator [Winogradskyella ursingii]|uniref:response regulator n=1 Tax=Winogradskyella ursingii TaxID=2686079 RepID=UPI0015CC3F79|nr:response regulator [Winogradskyella ursingii]
MKQIDIACIIDDDPIFVFGAKRMMELSDFCESFMIYKNGQEAIDNLKPIIISGENIPDVILLDINMPIMDGWQFLDEFIKIESSKEITIFIVSSSIDPADKERVKQYQNVSNYIVKPISIEKLKRISEGITEV